MQILFNIVLNWKVAWEIAQRLGQLFSYPTLLAKNLEVVHNELKHGIIEMADRFFYLDWITICMRHLNKWLVIYGADKIRAFWKLYLKSWEILIVRTFFRDFAHCSRGEIIWFPSMRMPGQKFDEVWEADIFFNYLVDCFVACKVAAVVSKIWVDITKWLGVGLWLICM